jgi:hypothetical protein
MNNSTIAVIAIVVLFVAAGVLLHPESPLTIIYLFPADLYSYWVRIFYPSRSPFPRPHPSPRPEPRPHPGPSATPTNFVPTNNGYDPGLGPLFPSEGSVPTNFVPQNNGYNPGLGPRFPGVPFMPVNPNNNITPYTPNPNPSPNRPSFPPGIQPIEPHHEMGFHPYSSL